MSFGLSRGRAQDISGYGLDHTDLPAFDIEDRAAALIDPRKWFENPSKPFELEIGSGKGTFLVQQAVLQPDINFLGVEHTKEFWRYAADRIRRRQCANVRMLWADAAEFLKHHCPDAVAQVVHLYFSDPWPKKRHHKRRVMQDATLADIHRILSPESPDSPAGELRIVTDHDDLWAWNEDHAQRHEHLFERTEFIPPESAGEGEFVGTNFERKFAVEGRTFRAMTLIRKNV